MKKKPEDPELIQPGEVKYALEYYSRGPENTRATPKMFFCKTVGEVRLLVGLLGGKNYRREAPYFYYLYIRNGVNAWAMLSKFDLETCAHSSKYVLTRNPFGEVEFDVPSGDLYMSEGGDE